MVKRLKVEFLVPLKYNDGTYVEPEKLYELREQIVDLFGGVTIHPYTMEGIWIDPRTNKKYYDRCRRFEILIIKSNENLQILRDLKKELMELFKQEEIYMVYTEITEI